MGEKCYLGHIVDDESYPMSASVFCGDVVLALVRLYTSDSMWDRVASPVMRQQLSCRCGLRLLGPAVTGKRVTLHKDPLRGRELLIHFLINSIETFT